MDLLNEINEVKSMTTGIGLDKETAQNYFFQGVKQIIDDDLTHNNPDTLYEKYRRYFKSKELPTKTIDTEAKFYRGRIGNEVFYGAEDDYNRSFIVPYYQQGIEAPPPIYTNGGRFNRQGVSYLYLADTIETCLAEVHLPIGQNCSVGEFKCKEKIDVIDFTKFNNDMELNAWITILTQPVHDGTEHIYNVTRFLADVFKSINSNGIYFDSVQTSGHNIVCFKPSLFRLVKYSEKIYTATKIEYKYRQVEDAIREYSKKTNRRYINSCNTSEDDKNEKRFDYLEEWIENEVKLQ